MTARKATGESRSN